MKFVCLFFAVVFLCSSQAVEGDLDQAEKPQGEALGNLSDLQDEEPALPAGDEVLENEGNILLRTGFSGCEKKRGNCFWGLCPRGTVTIGNCSPFYRCCRRK